MVLPLVPLFAAAKAAKTALSATKSVSRAGRTIAGATSRVASSAAIPKQNTSMFMQQKLPMMQSQPLPMMQSQPLPMMQPQPLSMMQGTRPKVSTFINAKTPWVLQKTFIPLWPSDIFRTYSRWFVLWLLWYWTPLHKHLKTVVGRSASNIIRRTLSILFILYTYHKRLNK